MNTLVITINGVARELPASAAVADAVAAVGASANRGVAVAVNGEVVPRAAWASTDLRAGDRVEVLTAAQGG